MGGVHGSSKNVVREASDGRRVERTRSGDSPTVVALVDYLIFVLANAEQMVGSDAMEAVKANMHSALVGVLS